MRLTTRAAEGDNVRNISFIHTSDIHLGHQQFNLEERFADFGRSFGDVVEFALNRQVDFIIIGGDFFHKRAINAETLKQSMELLQPLRDRDIPVIAIEGNHDKAFYQDKVSWLKLLNSLGYLKLLKPVYSEGRVVLAGWGPDSEGCVLEMPGVRVIGLGYLGATTEQRLLEAAEQIAPYDGYTILVLHAAVNKLLAQDLGGVRKDVLEKFKGKVDYIALGHIHSREEDGWAYNPGSLENCHIDEAREGREKGFYHVTVNGKEKTVQYMASRRRAVKIVSVDVTGAPDPAEVSRRVWAALHDLEKGAGEKPMVQVVIRGDLDFSSLAIDTSVLAAEIKEAGDCLYVEVQNNTNLQTELTGGTDLGTVSRNRIERQVLGRLLSARYPEFREHTDELVDLVVRVKEAALAGESAEDIVSAVASLASALPERQNTAETEAAAGGDALEDTQDQASEY